jgi:hypothetical protein
MVPSKEDRRTGSISRHSTETSGREWRTIQLSLMDFSFTRHLISTSNSSGMRRQHSNQLR